MKAATPLSRSTLTGTWATVLLPLADDDAIDYARLDRSLDVLVTAGLDGVYTNGTAGEFYALDEAECDKIQRLVADRCREGGMPFQLGAAHPCLHTSIERIRAAVPLGPAAIQVILPDWLPLTSDEAEQAFGMMVAAAGEVPLVLYNPPHAKTQVGPELLGRLAERFPTLIGAKTAGGDAAWYARIRAHAPELAVFVPGHDLATGRELGAAGSYSNIACLSPRGAAGWWRLMTTDPRYAREVEQRIHAFQATHIVPLQRGGFSNPALDKALAAAGGWADIGPRTRRPMTWVDAPTVAELAESARAMIPELFA